MSDPLAFGFLSHDPASAAGQIYELYRAILGRVPDTLGFEGALASLQSGTPLTTIAQSLLSSAEYASDDGVAAQTSNTTFVTQLYQDAFGRAPDAAGLQNWQTVLTGGTSRAAVAAAIATSAEAQADLAPSFAAGVFAPSAADAAIARLYDALLGRNPDATGLQGWSQAVTGGTPLTQVAQGIIQSPEFQATAAGQAVAGFVTNLYEAALGRAPDAAGLKGWDTAIETGQATLQQVAGKILVSTEFQADETAQSNAAYIGAVYQAALGRQADPSGLQSFQTQLANGLSRTQVAQAIVGSQEFAANVVAPLQSAFVTALYQGGLGRAPDAAGLQAYDAALAGGASFASVAVSIAESPEAIQHLAPKIEGGFLIG